MLAKVVIGGAHELFQFNYAFKSNKKQLVQDLLDAAISDNPNLNKTSHWSLPVDAYYTVYGRICGSGWEKMLENWPLNPNNEYLIMVVLATELRWEKV